MNVKNFTEHTEVADILYEAWQQVPKHWQKLIVKLPCDVSAHSPKAMKALWKKREADAIYKLEPRILACVFLNSGTYDICCCDVFINQSIQSGTYVLKTNFLRACAAALIHKHSWIEKWLTENIPPHLEPFLGMTMFFMHTFPRFCINRLWLSERKPDSDALMSGLNTAALLKVRGS